MRLEDLPLHAQQKVLRQIGAGEREMPESGKGGRGFQGGKRVVKQLCHAPAFRTEKLSHRRFLRTGRQKEGKRGT